jgi:CRISPR-associated protein Cmr1
MRDIPTFKDDYKVPDKSPARADYITQTREYELITPLFGGGVEPGLADPVTTIRATEIRGHLRFWWRATRGNDPKFDGRVDLMKKAEGELWGAVSSGNDTLPSQVSIQVVPTNRGRKFIAKTNRGEEVDVFDLKSPFGYAAFPLRDRRQHVIEGVKFRLIIHYPSSSITSVEAALWAWETFGGIGGRTRRGFGAINLLSMDGRLQPAPDANQVRQLITQKFAAHLADGKIPPDLPCISKDGRDLVIANQRGNAVDVWKYLINKLREFRQRRNQGNQPNRPGRSQWPEPDAIRRITGRASARHRHPLSQLDVYPRAEFGLPIVFKFKDNNQGDPNVAMLEGADDGAKRLASPLILRPLACANNQAVGLALVLDTRCVPPRGVRLNGAPDNPIVTSDLTELSDDELDSIAPLNGMDDVLAAFLDTL